MERRLLADCLQRSSRAAALKGHREAMEGATEDTAEDVLSDLPLTGRTELQSKLTDYLLDDPADLREAQASGSSGVPVIVLRRRDEAAVENAFVAAAWLRMGVTPGMRQVVLTGRRVHGEWHHLTPRGDVLWIGCPTLGAESFSRVHRLVQDFAPASIRGFGSLVGHFFAYLDAVNATPPASLVGTAFSSDRMLPSHRDLIIAMTGSRPIGLYGQNERAASNDQNLWMALGGVT